MRWFVTVEAATNDTHARITENDALRLAYALSDRDGEVTQDDGRYAATFRVVGPTDIEEAIDEAVGVFRVAADKLELPRWPIERIDVKADRTAGTVPEPPTGPVILGANETAALLGISRQRLDQLQDRPDFPKPIERLASGSVWFTAAIQRFQRRWPRQPGRAGRLVLLCPLGHGELGPPSGSPEERTWTRCFRCGIDYERDQLIQGPFAIN